MSHDEPDPETAAPDVIPKWQYAYLTGLVDNHANLVVTIGKDADRRIGYRVMVECRIKTERQNTVEFLQSVFNAHELPVRQVVHEEQAYPTHEFVLSQRQAVKRFLKLLRPYVVAREEAIDRLCKTIIPWLEAGKHQQKETFLELMKEVDAFRAAAGRGNRAKYDYEYIANEWDIEQ